nr:MAG TPA: hypothetical protein [Caudoviricetes sp.]
MVFLRREFFEGVFSSAAGCCCGAKTSIRGLGASSWRSSICSLGFLHFSPFDNG